MYCNRCGEFVMEFISEVDVTKDILDGIHVLMYHPFTSWNLSKTRFLFNFFDKVKLLF